MIAKFPLFTPLTLEVKADVERLTARFEPYSDFNFTSLLCWNTDGSTSVSEINDNLVVKFPDYITGKPIYTFIGNNDVDESITTVLKTVGRLELVPESVIEEIDKPDAYTIAEDTDQFDYVYSLAHHSSLSGGHFKSKRKMLGRFVRKHGHETTVKEIDLNDPKVAEQVKLIFDTWAKQKNTSESDVKQEREALERLVDFSESLNISGHIVSVGGEPAGFSVTEILDNNFAIYHFHKTLHEYDALDVHLTRLTSEQLYNRGAEHINWEQDLGIPGLRAAKSSYKPVKMLKKYSVELRNH